MFIILKIFRNKYILFSLFLILWLCEWLFFFDFYLLENSLNWFIPFKVPVVLYCLLVLWTLIWSISAWRRTLFGKFTRGDRKLWYKSLVSFWIIEISTIGGLVIAAAWMSWGPKHFIPRFFWVSKKGFVLELIIFSYIIWLLYLLRYATKWNFWYSQLFLVLLILFVTCYLLWRDVEMIYTRSVAIKDYGTKYKFIKLQSILYSLDHNWWLEMYMGKRVSLFSWYLPLSRILKTNSFPIFINKLNLIEYEQFIWQPFINKSTFLSVMLPFNIGSIYNYSYFSWNLKPIINNSIIFNDNFLIDSNQFLPRRLGFLPKRLAMWTFFVMLKIWHHLMLFIWWFLYWIKLVSLKKSSYSFINLGFFNLYCCFLLGWVIFIVQNFQTFELYLKMRPTHFFKSNYQSKHFEWLNYFYYLTFDYSYSKVTLEKNFFTSFFKISFFKI
jgi:hypothetical protein